MDTGPGPGPGPDPRPEDKDHAPIPLQALQDLRKEIERSKTELETALLKACVELEEVARKVQEVADHPIVKLAAELAASAASSITDILLAHYTPGDPPPLADPALLKRPRAHRY